MKRMTTLAFGIALALAAATVPAQNAMPAPPATAPVAAAPDAAVAPEVTFLPPEHAVETAILALPIARAAASRVQQAEADQRLRGIGPHEAELLLLPQRRRVDGSTRSEREYEVQLSSGLRWPNKVRLDREIGALGVDVATLRLGDAHHQGARLLLDEWMSWLTAAAQAERAGAQRALMQRERDAVATRVRLGDAAQRDLDLAEAGLARVVADALDAQARRDAARQRLGGDFPLLPLPERSPVLSAPQALDDPARWQALIIERSHEIGAAVAEAERMQRIADRARADRVPDPTVGLRYLNERSGKETALGVVVSIPLGVRARSARADADLSAADAAQAEADGMRRSITLEARLAVADAEAAQASWAQLARAREAAALAARRSQRAYALGEAGVADWLLAERQAGDAAMAEIDARARAQRAWLRIQVDSHALWHVHNEESAAGATGMPMH